MQRLGFKFISLLNLFVHVKCMSSEVSDEKLRKGYWFIRHATNWVILNECNRRIFTNTVKEKEELVEKIKVLSWRWTLARFKVRTCLYYDWFWSPQDCLLIWSGYVAALVVITWLVIDWRVRSHAGGVCCWNKQISAVHLSIGGFCYALCVCSILFFGVGSNGRSCLGRVLLHIYGT